MPTIGASSTISMKGGGYYSEHTRGAKDVIDNAAALALDALSSTVLEESERPFTIVDYGAADGGTSVDLIRQLIAATRSRAPTRPINVIYTDLPGNDYSSVFQMTQGQREGVRSYLDDFDGVYVTAAGTSFYAQILPPSSVDFGFTATAMHWLSTVPGRISNHVHAVGARGIEWQIYYERAMQDWSTILLHRAAELAPGARLVMANFCIDEEGCYLGATGGVNMFDTFNALWQGMVDAGAIDESEYTATAFPQFYKTVEQYCAPLKDQSGPVYGAGLRLRSASTRVVRCPYRAAFEQHGDANQFATAYVPTLRSWSETVFFNNLSQARPLAERQAIVDEFYRRYTDQVRQSPDGHAMDYVHIYMVVEKI